MRVVAAALLDGVLDPGLAGLPARPPAITPAATQRPLGPTAVPRRMAAAVDKSRHCRRPSSPLAPS
jgi:hypothetical protein